MTELSLFTAYTRLDAALRFGAYYLGLMLFLAAGVMTVRYWAPLFNKILPGGFFDREEQLQQTPHKQQQKTA